MQRKERRKGKMFYIITFEDGAMINIEGVNYSEAVDYADDLLRCHQGCSYTIEEYNSREDYYNNI